MRLVRHLTAAVGTLLLACSSGAPPTKPSANAGAGQNAWKGALVTLDGSASTGVAGAPLAYRWTQTGGPTVALSSATDVRPSFSAPHVSGALLFTLTVNDGRGDSAPSVTQVVVQDRAPVARTSATTLMVEGGDPVVLDGSQSSDPDGDVLQRKWQQLSGPQVVLAQAAGIAQFAAPAVTVQTSLVFALTVDDGEAPADTATVTVTVLPPGSNWPPLANAGSDQTVARRSQVTLYGSGSDREYDPLTYRWTQLAGPTVALTGDATSMLRFDAPADACDLTFQLAVSDPLAATLDEVVVHVRNVAPTVSVSIPPAAPVTTDALTAAVDARDADADALTLTYVWKRNGATVAGATTGVLPASETVRGDVLTVVVTASDGTLTGSGQASATILDAPPTLSSDAPVTAQHGATVSFHVTAVDPDGDPVGAFSLEYGPAGMQLTPDGLVTWQMTGPMFDRAQDFRWGVVTAGAAAGRLGGTIHVTDDARQYPLRRTGIEIPVARAGLVVADLDSDGRAEMLVASGAGLYELARSGSGYAQRWMYPFSPAGAGTVQALAARDLDGDGKAEIFFASGSALVKLDGVARREAARYVAAGQLSCIDLRLADLDGDGAVELVCLASTDPYGSNGKVVVFDAATLQVRWETAVLGLGRALAVGNVDGDPALEIVTAGGYVFDGKTHANEWAYGPGFGAVVDVGDLDADGVGEIVGLVDWTAVRVFSGAVKSPLYETAASDLDALWVGDIDGDGKAEILVGDGQWGNVTAWRYDAALKALTKKWQIDSQNHGVTAIGVGDVDGDGAYEFVWGSGASSSGEDSFVIAGLNPGIAVEWTNVNPNELDGPFLGGRLARLGGGTTRLVYAATSTNSGYDGTRLVLLDPATGLWQTGSEIGSNWNRRAALDVADVDGDGVDEVLLETANLYDGYFTSWDAGRGVAEWTSALKVGSAAAVTHADLNGDGYPDLVALTGEGYLHAYDVRNQVLLWKSTGLGGNGIQVAVADVDGDGTQEIIALTSTRAVVFHGSGAGTTWLEVASWAATSPVDLAVADGDGDGQLEIFVLASSKVVRLDGALHELGAFTLDASGVSLHVEDLGAARHNLLVAVGDAYAYYGSTTESRLRCLDAVTGSEVWRSPPLLGAVTRGSLAYVDVNGDGERAIAFATSSGMYLTR